VTSERDVTALPLDGRESLFDALRQRFNEADGKWFSVSEQADVLNLIDAAEALSVLLDPETITGSWGYTKAREKGREMLRRLASVERAT
jgi:hypothetical protein